MPPASLGKSQTYVQTFHNPMLEKTPKVGQGPDEGQPGGYAPPSHD
jgi:hypothetical protein